MAKKDDRIKKQFWIDKEDDALLKDKATRTCLSEVDFFRLILRAMVPKEKPDAEFYQALNQISSIGNNLNQIVRRANSLGFVDVPELEKEIEALRNFRLKLEEKYLLPEEDKTWR